MSTTSDNIKEIEQNIGRLLLSLGRKPDDCLLLVVTKTHTAIDIIPALEAGVKGIGENKVQEAASKLPTLREMAKSRGLSFDFHFIGHLQRNKVKQLLELEPDLIHSVDSVSLAEVLSRHQDALHPGKVQDILLQVNCSGEDSKSGFEPGEVLEAATEIAELPNLRIKGLMTIGLLAEDTEAARAGFRTLKELFDMLNTEMPKLEMTWLSMGMTDDYPIALEEGANLVRIGSAIFGSRKYGARR